MVEGAVVEGVGLAGVGAVGDAPGVAAGDWPWDFAARIKGATPMKATSPKALIRSRLRVAIV